MIRIVYLVKDFADIMYLPKAESEDKYPAHIIEHK